MDEEEDEEDSRHSLLCLIVVVLYGRFLILFVDFQSNMEKKTARQKCMENRLRLGQFVTQRQGASFVENWVDGFAFTDLLR